jgi:hypothetical protein
MARNSIRSGAALRCLDHLISLTQSLAPDGDLRPPTSDLFLNRED